MKKIAISAALALMLGSNAFAEVKTDGAWVRATVPGQPATGVFVTLTSDKDAALVGAESTVAKTVEVHEMAMENDVMKMRAIEKLDLPANQAVELKPGGYHVMLIDLHDQVKEGDQVPVTLLIKNADGSDEKVEITAEAKMLGEKMMDHQHHEHHMPDMDNATEKKS